MIEWLKDVAVPIEYVDGIYHIQAIPYTSRGHYGSRTEYRRKIIQHISGSPGNTQAEICKKLKIRSNVLNPILKEMVESGEIVKINRKAHLKRGGDRYYLP